MFFGACRSFRKVSKKPYKKKKVGQGSGKGSLQTPWRKDEWLHHWNPQPLLLFKTRLLSEPEFFPKTPSKFFGTKTKTWSPPPQSWDPQWLTPTSKKKIIIIIIKSLVEHAKKTRTKNKHIEKGWGILIREALMKTRRRSGQRLDFVPR